MQADAENDDPVALDEAHHARHALERCHASVRRLQASLGSYIAPSLELSNLPYPGDALHCHAATSHSPLYSMSPANLLQPDDLLSVMSSPPPDTIQSGNVMTVVPPDAMQSADMTSVVSSNLPGSMPSAVLSNLPGSMTFAVPSNLPGSMTSATSYLDATEVSRPFSRPVLTERLDRKSVV